MNERDDPGDDRAPAGTDSPGRAERDAAAGDPPGRPGVGNLLEALSVRRNATVGVVVGVLVAAGVYAVRVFELLGPSARQDPVGGPVLFLLLAFVLAFGTFVLVTFALTLASAYRRTREL